MAPNLALSSFYRDGRGNRLEAWTVAASQSGHHLWLRGSDESVQQVRSVEPAYQPAEMPRPAPLQWTHVLWAPGSLGHDTQLLLDLLSTVITLPELPHTHSAVVIDWYKIPQDGVDPYSWANTDVGDLVNRGKYRTKFDPVLQTQVGRELCAQMCDVVTIHPLLRAAHAVLDVPGHDSSHVSFGSRVAATVARDTQKTFVKVGTRDAFRPPAKSIIAAERAAALQGQFSVGVSLEGQDVIIVDDVFHSGQSMAAVANAAVTAGARTVYGFCAVRTMRR